jgi:hypothetical protein
MDYRTAVEILNKYIQIKIYHVVLSMPIVLIYVRYSNVDTRDAKFIIM